MADLRGRPSHTGREASSSDSEWLVEAVETRLRAGQTYEQAAEELARLKEQGKYDWTPSVRTIRSWVATGKVSRPPRPTDPWSLLTGSADDAALVLPVVPFITALPRTARWITIREAEAIARVRRAAPDIAPGAAATLGILYVTRERKRAATSDLDMYLASAPWRSPDAQNAYEEAAEAAGMQPIWVSPTTPGEWLASMKSLAGVPFNAELDAKRIRRPHKANLTVTPKED